MSPLAFGLQPPAYRLPDATRLGRVRLQVTNLERSLEFYTAILGFRVVARRDGAVELGVAGTAGAAQVILELRSGAAHPVPSGGRQGLFHFAILLPDRASLGRLLVHLGNNGVHAGASDHLVSEALYLSDPDGLGIEVYADRPRDTWRQEGRELVMTTIALDAPALFATAGGTPWTGMPAGTTLGHVHLHVGSLEEARAFYHDGLGFDLTVWSYPGALFYSAGGYHHHLGTNTWAAGRPSAAEDEARLLDWEIVLPDATSRDALRQHMDVRGHAATRADNGWAFVDPWGTQVTIVGG